MAVLYQSECSLEHQPELFFQLCQNLFLHQQHSGPEQSVDTDSRRFGKCPADAENVDPGADRMGFHGYEDDNLADVLQL